MALAKMKLGHRSTLAPSPGIAALLLVVVGSHACATTTDVIPTDIAVQAFQERHSLCEHDGGKLWGRSLCGPMMFTDPGSRQAVLNRPAPGAVKDGTIYRLVLPANTSFANTAMEYEGQRWSMVLWPLPTDRIKRDILLMHESYHRIQPKLGLEGVGSPNENGHLDTRDGRIWLRAELNALRVALQAHGEKRNQALRDALQFRAYRRSLWPEATKQERDLELQEGLAESTGIDLTVADRAGRIKAALDDIARAEAAPSLVRSFAYATGPAYSELLNMRKPDWRHGLSKHMDLGQFVAEAYGIQASEPNEKNARLALSRYDGARILAEENARAKKITQRDAEYTREFITGPTITFPLKKFSISFNPQAVASFDKHGTVYGMVHISDTWGSLDVRSGGALVSSGFDRISVPAGSQISIRYPAGQGWTAQLNPGLSLAPLPGKPGSYELTTPQASSQ